MGRWKIDSTITMEVEGCEMSHSRHKHKHRDKSKASAPVIKESTSGKLVRSSSDSHSTEQVIRQPKSKGKAKAKPHKHHYESRAVSDKDRFFHGVQSRNHNHNQGVTQNVKVDVKVEQADDCLTSCIGSLAKCFGR